MYPFATISLVNVNKIIEYPQFNAAFTKLSDVLVKFSPNKALKYTFAACPSWLVASFQSKVGDKVITSNYAMWIDGPLTPEKEAKNLDLCYTCDGCMCEVFTMHENAFARMPSHLSYEEAAVLPCTGVTAWNDVFTYGGLQSGQTVLLPGTGGVSIFALKFAKVIGAKVIITGVNDDVLARQKIVEPTVALTLLKTRNGTKPCWNTPVGLASILWLKSPGPPPSTNP